MTRAEIHLDKERATVTIGYRIFRWFIPLVRMPQIIFDIFITHYMASAIDEFLLRKQREENPGNVVRFPGVRK